MKEVRLDTNQKNLLSKLKKIASKKSFFSFFEKKKKGAYIYGTVGSGKTETLRNLYESISETKKLF
ncbi:MAG: cell division protein ZapE, partial [Rickettsiales bacterium]